MPHFLRLLFWRWESSPLSSSPVQEKCPVFFICKDQCCHRRISISISIDSRAVSARAMHPFALPSRSPESNKDLIALCIGRESLLFAEMAAFGGVSATPEAYMPRKLPYQRERCFYGGWMLSRRVVRRGRSIQLPCGITSLNFFRIPFKLTSLTLRCHVPSGFALDHRRGRQNLLVF